MGSSTLGLVQGRAPRRMNQLVAVLVVSLGPLATGLGKGYYSPAVTSMQAGPKLPRDAMAFSVDQEQGSWIASLSLLGAFFGGLPGAMAMKYGRRRVLKVVSLPFALFWLLTVFANDVRMVYASSFLCGMCSAVISLVTPVYISEISDPDIRGCLCSLGKLAAHIGMLLSFIVGSYVNWRQLAMFAAIAPASLFAMVWAIPETPSYLLFHERERQAQEALSWFNPDRDVLQEMQTMKENIKDMKLEDSAVCCKEWRRDIVRPLLITCGMMILQKFSGATAFNFYAVPILSEAFKNIDPYNAAIVISLLQIVAGMISSLLIDRVGRLPLLVLSNFFMSVALAGFGTFLYFADQSADDVGGVWDWIPMVCVAVFQVAFAVGTSPISWLYIGELFPLNYRGLGAIANSVSYACSFVSVKTFVNIKNIIGLHGSFWVYAGFSVVGLVFTLVFVPETKGKNLHEMERKFSNGEIPEREAQHEVSTKLI